MSVKRSAATALLSPSQLASKYARKAKKSPGDRVKYKTGRYAVATGAFAAAVKKVIQHEAEKKQVQYYEANRFIVAYNATASPFASSIFPCTPYGASLTINQGTGDAARIGNRIKISKLRLKGMFTPTPYSLANNATPEPMMLRMWLLYDKENPTAIPVPAADFIQFGNAAQALTSTVQDMVAKVNNDRWVVKYDKVFKLGFSTYGGTGTSAAYQSFTNNDFNLVQEFDIDLTDMVPKTYVFDDNTSIPETRGLFLVVEAVPVNGVAPGTNLIAAEMTFSLDLEYTDL